MDSFDDRIDDDLFELIISYLPIIDKLIFESVSKRFQRLVFNKQNVLRISCKEDSVHNLNGYYLTTNGEINVLTLERILKKFRFITAIEFVFDSYISNPSEILNTITENCDHLTSIGFDFIVHFEVLEKFCQKFGQQLRHIHFLFEESVLSTDMNFYESETVLGDFQQNRVDFRQR